MFNQIMEIEGFSFSYPIEDNMTPEIKERLLKELKTARNFGNQNLPTNTELILAINRLGDVLAEVLDYL